jgi:hypothetical protein
MLLYAAHRVTVAGHVNTGTIDLGDGPIPDSPDVRSFVAELDVDGNYLWSRPSFSFVSHWKP